MIPNNKKHNSVLLDYAFILIMYNKNDFCLGTLA